MKHKKEAPQPEKTVGEDKRGEAPKSEAKKGEDKKTGNPKPGDPKSINKKKNDYKNDDPKTGDKESTEKDATGTATATGTTTGAATGTGTSAEAAGKQPNTSSPDASPAEQSQNDLLDRYQRTMAEFDNYRKRTNKEKAAMYDDGLRDTVEKLLPIIDNFERALNAAASGSATDNAAENENKNENKEDKFYQGVLMIARQIGGYLTDLGVEVIPAGEGEVFNPNYHFAVAHIEDPAYGTNVIVNELQRGYKHKDKVIRPSMVRVAN